MKRHVYVSLLITAGIVVVQGCGAHTAAARNGRSASSVQASLVRDSIDKFTGAVRQSTAPAKLDGARKSLARIDISFSRAKDTKLPDVAYCFLTMHYHWTDWMFIEDGNSLLIKADDSTFVLRETGRANLEALTDTVSERASYSVLPADLDVLANARVVAFRLIGKKMNVERTLSKSARERLLAFRAAIAADPARKCFAMPE